MKASGNGNGRLIGREAFLAARPLKHEDVTIEGVGTIRLRELRGVEREEFESAIRKTDAKGNTQIVTKGMRALLLRLTAINEDGTPMFAESDLPSLGQLEASVLLKTFEVGSRLNGLSVKDAEEVEKNSELTPIADSTST